MRHKKTKAKGKSEEFALPYQVGDKSRSKYGLVRYVEVVEFANSHWTKSKFWQRLDEQEWIEIEWTDFDILST